MAAIVRTLLLAGVLGAVVLSVFWWLARDEAQKARDEMAALRAEMQARLDAHEEMVRRLSRSRRLMRVFVTGQRVDAGGDMVSSDVVLVELDDDGSELARQAFTIPGDVIFIDAWTVKFDPAEVAAGHPLRGRTLVLLRRIFSEQMAPAQGFPIDLPGAVPPAYAVGDLGHYEQQIWAHFWEIATDPERAASMGVRVAQGEVVYKPVATGQSFDLVVDASGGMSLTPLAAAD
jgi:hypothetical protein